MTVAAVWVCVVKVVIVVMVGVAVLMVTIMLVMSSYTVRKEMKCSGDSEKLYTIVRDTTRISSFFMIFVKYHELFHVVSRNPRYTSFPGHHDG